jgi:hypothetical protein
MFCSTSSDITRTIAARYLSPPSRPFSNAIMIWRGIDEVEEGSVYKYRRMMMKIA